MRGILTMRFLPRVAWRSCQLGFGRTRRSVLWCREARDGGLYCAAIEDCLRWIEYAACGRNREGSSQGAGDFYEGTVCFVRAVRRLGDSEEFAEDRLGSGAGAGDREAGLVCFGCGCDGACGRTASGLSIGARGAVGEREELRH